ncbi:MAG: N-acetylmuramoyl-L-alanine amidase family protein [Clostridium sp.]
MKKKIISSLIITLSLAGFSSIPVQAAWKTDSYNNKVWVEQGGIKQGWNYIDNFWYYLGADGVPITGWLMEGDDWYYMWSNGTMARNSWMTNGGFWYYFDNSGKMVTDYVNVGQRQYDFTNTAIIISTTPESVSVKNEESAKLQEELNSTISDDSKIAADTIETSEDVTTADNTAK